jgi:hypothetical protein
MRTAVLLALFSALGCTTFVPIHRPPTPDEIARINDTAENGGPLVVEPLRLPVNRIARVDQRKVELVARTGAPLSLPLENVSGFTLKRRDRGVAIGAGVGAGAALVEILGLVALGALLSNSGLADPGAPHSSGCDDKCTEFIVGISAVSIGVGALIGGIVGSPQAFPLNIPAPAASP